MDTEEKHPSLVVPGPAVLDLIFYQILSQFIVFYRILIGFYRILLDFIGFLLDFIGFYRILLDFIGFYWILLDSTGGTLVNAMKFE